MPRTFTTVFILWMFLVITSSTKLLGRRASNRVKSTSSPCPTRRPSKFLSIGFHYFSPPKRVATNSLIFMSSSSSSSSFSSRSVADLRKDYSNQGLDETQIPSNPFPLFHSWLHEAVEAKVLEPNAMCLSTVSKDGRPSARFVLLKGLDDRGFVWFTNYNSRKSQELELNDWACLTFWWGDLERSVRIEGRVEKVSEEESEAYFSSRPVESQIGAWASNQSSPISSREVLEKQYTEIKARFKAQKEEESIPKPPHWGGLRLLPTRVEFWKGRASRLHDRLVYSKEDISTQWTVERLQP